jgi:hypothetical protein
MALLAIRMNEKRDEDAEWLEKLRWLFFWME